MGAIAVRGGAILLIRRGRRPGKGRWSVPGGRVEPGEKLTRAVIREFSEETGLTCECGDLVGWVERISRDSHYVILDFEVTVTSGSGCAPVAASDAAEARWCRFDELERLPLVQGLADFLRDHRITGPAGNGGLTGLTDPSTPGAVSR